MRIEGGVDTSLTGTTLRITRAHDSSPPPIEIPLHGKRSIPLEPLPAGSYSIELMDRDGQALARQSFDIGPRATSEVRMKLASLIDIKVRVRDRTGSPMLAIVRVRPKGSDSTRKIRIPRGSGTIQLLPGTWLLKARTVPGHPEFGAERELELRPGFDREIEFDLR